MDPDFEVVDSREFRKLLESADRMVKMFASLGRTDIASLRIVAELENALEDIRG